VSNSLLLFASIVVLGVVSWQLLLICAIAVPPVVAASIWFQRESNTAYLDVRDGIGTTLSHLQEGISGVRVVQAFAREDVESVRFEEGNRRLYDAHMRSVKISAWYLPVIELAGLGTTAAAVGIGGWWVHDGALTIGTVAFFVLTLSNLFEPIQQLSQLFNTVQSAGAGLAKLFGLLDTEVDVPERAGAVDLPSRSEIVLSDVGFSYADGTEVLHGIDLRISPGERLALVGPTGAGKSTLAKLIARYYDPTHGSVSIGGVDLRNVTASSLRAKLAVVPQEGFLFKGPCSTTSASPAPTPPTTRSSPRWPASGSSIASPGSPTGWRPRSASGAVASRRGRSSWSRWPGRRSPTPRSSCWTRQPRPSTPGPRRWSKMPWSGCPRAGPRS
jgi:ATP-binding cassette subfamily B protein